MNFITIIVGLVLFTSLLIDEEQAHDKTKAKLSAALDTISIQGSMIDTYERKLMVSELACE